MGRVVSIVERGVLLRVFGDEVEEVPLGHQRDELALRRQRAEVGERELDAHEVADQHRRLLVRAAEEFVEQAEFVDDLERGGVDRVAAELAEEVGVLLEDDHIDAGAGEQPAEHHPRRPATGGAALRANHFGRHEGFPSSDATTGEL